MCRALLETERNEAVNTLKKESAVCWSIWNALGLEQEQKQDSAVSGVILKKLPHNLRAIRRC